MRHKTAAYRRRGGSTLGRRRAGRPTPHAGKHASTREMNRYRGGGMGPRCKKHGFLPHDPGWQPLCMSHEMSWGRQPPHRGRDPLFPSRRGKGHAAKSDLLVARRGMRPAKTAAACPASADATRLRPGQQLLSKHCKPRKSRLMNPSLSLTAVLHHAPGLRTVGRQAEPAPAARPPPSGSAVGIVPAAQGWKEVRPGGIPFRLSRSGAGKAARRLMIPTPPEAPRLTKAAGLGSKAAPSSSVHPKESNVTAAAKTRQAT